VVVSSAVVGTLLRGCRSRAARPRAVTDAHDGAAWIGTRFRDAAATDPTTRVATWRRWSAHRRSEAYHLGTHGIRPFGQRWNAASVVARPERCELVWWSAARSCQRFHWHLWLVSPANVAVCGCVFLLLVFECVRRLLCVYACVCSVVVTSLYLCRAVLRRARCSLNAHTVLTPIAASLSLVVTPQR
jgi:hypothetical protein